MREFQRILRMAHEVRLYSDTYPHKSSRIYGIRSKKGQVQVRTVDGDWAAALPGWTVVAYPSEIRAFSVKIAA